MGQKVSLEDQLIDLKLNAKTLERAQKKCEGNRKLQLARVQAAVKAGDAATARIYAENAIRERKQGNSYLSLASRLDAVADRIESAMRANKTSQALASASKSMTAAMKAMDVEAIASTMGKFEQELERLDVTTAGMTSSLDSATASQMPEDQVDALIRQVADEHSLEVDQLLSDAGPVGTALPGQSQAQQAREREGAQAATGAQGGGGMLAS